MSSASTTNRQHPVIGVVLTAALAVGASVLASSASQAGAPTPGTATTRLGRSADCPAIGLLVAAAVTATTPHSPTNAVTSALSRAAGAARATASDDVRELAQNLADDLVAYRTTLTTPSDTSGQRHLDLGAALRGDLTSLRRACGL